MRRERVRRVFERVEKFEDVDGRRHDTRQAAELRSFVREVRSKVHPLNDLRDFDDDEVDDVLAIIFENRKVVVDLLNKADDPMEEEHEHQDK